MMTHTMNGTAQTTRPASPLAGLGAAEATLMGAIDEATARLDAVATGAVEKALARMEDAARQAAGRIAAALARVNDLAAGILASLEGTAGTIAAQVHGGVLPAPVEESPADAWREEVLASRSKAAASTSSDAQGDLFAPRPAAATPAVEATVAEVPTTSNGAVEEAPAVASEASEPAVATPQAAQEASGEGEAASGSSAKPKRRGRARKSTS